jgi:hypothetical protein
MHKQIQQREKPHNAKQNPKLVKAINRDKDIFWNLCKFNKRKIKYEMKYLQSSQ